MEGRLSFSRADQLRRSSETINSSAERFACGINVKIQRTQNKRPTRNSCFQGVGSEESMVSNPKRLPQGRVITSVRRHRQSKIAPHGLHLSPVLAPQDPSHPQTTTIQSKRHYRYPSQPRINFKNIRSRVHQFIYPSKTGN